MLTDWFGFKVDVDNVPLKLPGVYKITCISNGKVYIGISANVYRRARTHAYGQSPRKLATAIKKYELCGFLFEPIYYQFDGSAVLPYVEQFFIACSDSVRKGYNVCDSMGKAGPYGEEFSELKRKEALDPERMRNFIELQKSLWKDPSYRERRAKSFANSQIRNSEEYKAARKEELSRGRKTIYSDPEIRANKAAKIIETWQQDSIRAAQSARLKAACQRPEVFENKSKGMRAAWAKEGGSELQSLRTKGKIWITNGTDNKRISQEITIPDGWKLGRARNVKFGPKPDQYKWITDGSADKQILKELEVPVGWFSGRTNGKPPFRASVYMSVG